MQNMYSEKFFKNCKTMKNSNSSEPFLLKGHLGSRKALDWHLEQLKTRNKENKFYVNKTL